MAGLINLRLLTDFFNKIGQEPTSAAVQLVRRWGATAAGCAALNRPTEAIPVNCKSRRA
jgi:hypothetical protein